MRHLSGIGRTNALAHVLTLDQLASLGFLSTSAVLVFSPQTAGLREGVAGPRDVQ